MKLSTVAWALVALVILIPCSRAVADWERFTDLNVTGQVYAMLEVGDDLYIGGSFDTTVNGEHLWHVARRAKDGTWHALGGGVNGSVWALAYDQGTILVGGEFDSVSGGFEGGVIPAGGIAQWSGKSWDVMGGGFREHYQGVHAIIVTSTGVYAGGDFETTALGDSVHNIAHYDGLKWNALGGGIGRWRGALPVWKIAPWKNGIAVAGYFMSAGGHPGSGIALWEDNAWTTIYDQASEIHTQSVSGFNGSIAYTGEFGLTHPGLPAFIAYDGHSTYAIPSPGIVTGPSTVINGAVVIGTSPISTPEDVYHNIAMFNAGTWEELSGGVNNTVLSLTPDKNGTGLLASGYFTQAGGQPTNGFAIWRPEAAVIEPKIEEHLTIFPNPSSDRVVVSASSIELRNSLGQQLHVPVTHVTGGTELDISSAPSGIYFVRTEKGTSRLVKR